MSLIATALEGTSLIAGRSIPQAGEPFFGYNPADATRLPQPFYAAAPADVAAAVAAAVDAAPVYANTSNQQRAAFLRLVADGLDAAAPALIAQANLETALPIPRLTGEVARTSGQLRLFAQVVEEGSWVMARIDTANPARTPPKPDLRSMLRPLGPVVVFGASNFPLAFSVCGGDTASALAAGNPVLVKAHPAHPATSELAGRIVADALAASKLPAGIFSLLFDHGYTVGAALVTHPEVKAVGFTGSFRGGRALMDLAATRPVPIPVYAEMGSSNPVFILPGALAERGEALAQGLHGSFTLGGGQFCTKPGLVFTPEAHDEAFTARLRALTTAGPAFSLLTGGIARVYEQGLAHRTPLTTAHGAAPAGGFGAQASLLETSFAQFAGTPELAEELFGPSTLLIHTANGEDLIAAARALEGHLTATILGTDEDLAANHELLQILETRVGRVIFNAFPTGVEVAHAMVHGGPYPATSDGRSTSVGSQAIFRFARPVAYQGFPQAALPPALQDTNPENLRRLEDGAWTT